MRAYPVRAFLFSRAHASAARQSEREATIAHTIALALTEMDTDGSRTITFQVPAASPPLPLSLAHAAGSPRMH